MRRPTPQVNLPARAIAAGVASALTLAACGGSAGVDTATNVGAADARPDAAPDPVVASSRPEAPAAAAVAGGNQPSSGSETPETPGLPVASDQVEETPVAQQDDSGTDVDKNETPAVTQAAVTTTTTAVETTAAAETTAAPTTQPPSTTEAPTTTQPAAVNLPNLAVLDLASGSSVGFPQAAHAGGLPMLLWFWSPT